MVTVTVVAAGVADKNQTDSDCVKAVKKSTGVVLTHRGVFLESPPPISGRASV